MNATKLADARVAAAAGFLYNSHSRSVAQPG